LWSQAGQEALQELVLPLHTQARRELQREKRRLGALTKQGNALLRYLWREAAGQAVPQDEELKRFYRRKLAQKAWGKQKWRLVASWEFGSGSCCVTRWSTTSSAVADGSAGKPMRRGLPINMVRHTL